MIPTAVETPDGIQQVQVPLHVLEHFATTHGTVPLQVPPLQQQRAPAQRRCDAPERWRRLAARLAATPAGRAMSVRPALPASSGRRCLETVRRATGRVRRYAPLTRLPHHVG